MEKNSTFAKNIILKKLFSDTIIYGIGAILPRIITFALNPFYIHFIDKEEFAKFTNLYSWVALLNIVLTFGFETSFFRYSAEKGRERSVFNTSFLFLLASSGLFLGSVLLFNGAIANALDYTETPEYIRWFAWIAFFDTLCVIPFAYLRFKGKPIQYSLVRVASTLIQTLCVLAFFLWISKEMLADFGLKTQVSYAFFSNVISSVFVFLLLLPIILKVRFEFSLDLFKKMFKYSFPVMLAGLAFMVNEHFDKLIQYYIIDKGDAGAYGGCYKLAVLMTLFVTAYRMGVEPFFFKQMGDKDAPKTYAKITEYFTFFAAISAMGLIANISWLKRLFITDRAYWVAIDIVPIIIMANLCFGVYYNFSTWYKVTDRTGIGTLISWVGAGLTIVLNLVFLEKFGLMVSAWVTLIAYLSMMLISYFLGQKYYPIPYRSQKIFFVLCLLAVLSFISVYIFDYNVWIGNLLFLLFSGFLIFSERKMLRRN